MYQNSVDALMALDQHAVEELRSYRNPPDGVKKVMSAVCMLFDVPMSRSVRILSSMLVQLTVVNCLSYLDYCHTYVVFVYLSLLSIKLY